MPMFKKRYEEKPDLENQDSVKCWLHQRGIKFNESAAPPATPRPYEAAMATRLASKLYLKPKSEGEERQKRDAEIYFTGLGTLREKTDDSNIREYVWQFEQMVKNHGSRLADETRKVQNKIQKIYEGRTGLRGKLIAAFDYLGWRGGTAYVVYRTLNNSLADTEIDIFGAKLKGSDIAGLAFVGSIAGTTIISDKWKDSKEKRQWKRLKKKSKRIYENSIFETGEIYQRFFEGAIKGLKPKKKVNGGY